MPTGNVVKFHYENKGLPGILESNPERKNRRNLRLRKKMKISKKIFGFRVDSPERGPYKTHLFGGGNAPNGRGKALS